MLCYNRNKLKARDFETHNTKKMRVEDELALSFYREISTINERKNVRLVQHIETKEFFVRKDLAIYDKDVYGNMQRGAFPQTPKIIEVIEGGTRLIVIEEYIQGKGLDELMKSKVFKEDEVRDIASQICDILKPFHSHKPAIIHRDIKPSNIIMQGNQVYLIDFNASRDYEPGEARDTVLMGTQEYAAPEQFGFSQSTPKTDIYAIGALMSIMLTGKAPTYEKAKGEIGEIIGKCTAIDPKDRYENVSELKDALNGKKKSFAPPGFRSRKPILMILAGLWYLAIISLSATLEVTRHDGVAPGIFETVMNRIAVFVVFMGVTLYLGNYIGFLEKFPFRKTSSIPLEILRIALGLVVIVMTPIVVLVLVSP